MTYSKFSVGAAVAGAGVFGLAVRLAAIRASLSLDEFSTLWAVESNFADVMHRVPQVMGQTAFYYSLVWASVHAFGESELALRLPGLLSVAGCAAAIGFAGGTLGGWKGATWSAVLFWLCYPAIWASVDARPYGLAFCCAAVAVLGFVRACLHGRRRDRALWIVGAAGLAWSHYIFVPFLLAFPAMYALRASLRHVYLPRRFLIDAGLVVILLLPALPQLVAIAASPQSQQWVLRSNPLGAIGLFAPFLLAALFPTRRDRSDMVRRDLRRALWLAVALQFCAVAAGSLAGVEVLVPRYAGVVVVGAALLAGDNLSRLARADLVAPVSVFAIVTGLILAANHQLSGSMSGAGFQQWREGVAALRLELSRAPGAPVLFRSGNAEDDHGRLGEFNWPATLAPLRGPGQAAPNWNIALLTYRWNTPERSEYFENSLAPRIADQSLFFMLCQASAEPGANGYCDNVVAWTRQKWPDRFRAVPLGTFRMLTVLRFERISKNGSSPQVPARLEP